MSYPDLDEPECEECGVYHTKLICDDCAKEKYGKNNKEMNEDE